MARDTMRSSAEGLRERDFVRLPTGGPVMTVDRIVGAIAQLSWHTPTGRVGCGTAPVSTLVRVRRMLDGRQVWTEAKLGFVESGAGI